MLALRASLSLEDSLELYHDRRDTTGYVAAALPIYRRSQIAWRGSALVIEPRGTVAM